MSIEEVKDYALQTKEAVEQSNISEIHDIHAALANDLNISLDEYFTHPNSLKQYKDLLLVDKYIDKLFEDGMLSERYTTEEFTKRIMEENQASININPSVIQ